jgi:hypothetical protein
MADAVLIGTRGTSATNTVSTVAGASTGGATSTFVIVCSFDPSTTNNTPTDTFGNTYSIVGTVMTAGGGSKLVRYRCVGGTGGAGHAATMTFSASAFSTLHLIELTGLIASPVDVAVQGTDATSPYTISSGALAQADEVLIAALEQNVGGAGAYSSSNFTVLSNEPDTGSFWTSGVAKLVVSASSSVTPSFTRLNATDAVSNIFVDSYKATASGGVPALMGQGCY